MTACLTRGLVFVVDDIENNRLLAEASLDELGWQVRPFSDAESALECIEHVVPEAMLIDVRMPGMFGDLLATILRNNAATERVRLVAYTASALPEEISALRASGFDEVLLKPALLAHLARALPARIAEPQL